MPIRLALLVLLGGAGAAAQDTPGIAGNWTLNRELSQDLGARIREAAGSEHMSGGPDWATETWLPWQADFGEPARLRVRDFLLATVPAFDVLQIRPRTDDVQTTHGEASVRIFNLKRKSAGTSAMTGETVQREARLDGARLVLESKGKDSRLRETLTLQRPGNRLLYELRLEQARLKRPLEARLIYDRAP